MAGSREGLPRDCTFKNGSRANMGTLRQPRAI
jgi:hypothetical protein